LTECNKSWFMIGLTLAASWRNFINFTVKKLQLKTHPRVH
jgi:hypothetical protein